MQALTRALFSLRGACSSSGQLAARSFSEAAAGRFPAAPPASGSRQGVGGCGRQRQQRWRRQRPRRLLCAYAGRETVWGGRNNGPDPAALWGAAGVPQAAAEAQGAKAALFKILGAAGEPLTSGALPVIACAVLHCCCADAVSIGLPPAAGASGGGCAARGVLLRVCCRQRRRAGNGVQ